MAPGERPRASTCWPPQWTASACSAPRALTSRLVPGLLLVVAIMDVDVLIVGAGPAGSAAALRLAALAPDLASRTLMLDHAVFPRDKPCGGGIVRQSDALLRHLGVALDVPSVDVHTVRFQFAGGSADHRGHRMFRVVRRVEFDHALLTAARSRGIQVHEGERVVGFRRDADAIHVETTAGSYRAQVVVGADGARSRVRRDLVPGRPPERFVALEVLARRRSTGAGDDHTAVFDFRAMGHGLRGYSWDFPCMSEGSRAANHGVGGTTWPADTSLRAMLAARLHEDGITIDPSALKGATAPLYHPSTPQSAERVVLAGDAVGIDPWFGEGISVALGTGMLAAHAVVDAFARQDLGFRSYRRAVRDSGVGWLLRRSRVRARTFYRRAAENPAAHLTATEGLSS